VSHIYFFIGVVFDQLTIDESSAWPIVRWPTVLWPNVLNSSGVCQRTTMKFFAWIMLKFE